MVLCAVVGCSNRSGRNKKGHKKDGKKVSFFRIPAIIKHTDNRDLKLSTKRRDGYLAAISRDDLTTEMLDNSDYRVCSDHFVDREPAKLYDFTNPNWLPTLNLGHTKQKSNSDYRRHERAKRRGDEQRVREEEECLFTQQVEVVGITELDIITNEIVLEIIRETAEEEAITESSIVKVADCLIFDCVEFCLSDVIKETMEFEITRRSEGKCKCASEIKALNEELRICRSTIDCLSMKLKEQLPPFCEESLKDDSVVLFHTGLPNFKVLKAIFDHVLQTLPNEGVSKLTPFQEFMCTMLKLRLNTPLQGLAYQFGICKATVSRIILKWLTQLDIRLQDLIIWPDRESLRKTMPMCFQESFGKKVAVIIDCFEIFLDRPSNLQARAYTWSNYKHKNTCKVLIGIVPQGTVAFVSEAWGGRSSDKYITEHCGILKKLLPGDVILADRGFDIAESVGTMQARLHIPAFTKGKSQLSALEVEETRSIANVRIHVERVIGLVRQKYSILQCTLPIQYVIKRAGEDTPLIDRMIRVCCALTNVCDSVVSFD